MRIIASALLLAMTATFCPGEEVLFEDNFKEGLSDKWEVIGLAKTDYRISDGGLELRVQARNPGNVVPRLQLLLPLPPEDSVIASVKVIVLDEFTEDREYAGIQLLDETGSVFSGYQQRIQGKRVYWPGKPVFTGQKGEEGDGNKYRIDYTEVTDEAGPLEIVSRPGLGFFRVGPSKKDRKYTQFFFSAIHEAKSKRGIALVAAGAPEGVSHWVRFENVRFVKP
jgi:hypothetical protein